MQNYLTSVAAAVSGYEGFSSNHPDATVLYKTSLLLVFIYIVYTLLFSYGAARLSYNYNLNIGTSSGMTVLYVILCFLFSGFYYPYYAIMLDPLGKRRK